MLVLSLPRFLVGISFVSGWGVCIFFGLGWVELREFFYEVFGHQGTETRAAVNGCLEVGEMRKARLWLQPHPVLPCCFLQRLCSSAPAAAVAKADIWVSMARDCVQQLNKFHYSDNFSIEMTQNGTDILPFFPQLLLISRRVFLKK